MKDYPIFSPNGDSRPLGANPDSAAFVPHLMPTMLTNSSQWRIVLFPADNRLSESTNKARVSRWLSQGPGRNATESAL
jgi:hypothetical protein